MAALIHDTAAVPGRNWELPPTDLLAEAMSLWHVLDTPALMATVDLAPLLNGSWEHRHAWQAMVRVRMRGVPLVYPDFFLGWRRDLCEHECVPPAVQSGARHHWWTPGACRAYSVWYSLEQARAACQQRVRPDVELGGPACDLPQHGLHSPQAHTFEFWRDRLRDVAECRRLILHAEQVVERAWRVDLDGARVAASAVAQAVETKPVWERDAG